MTLVDRWANLKIKVNQFTINEVECNCDFYLCNNEKFDFIAKVFIYIKSQKTCISTKKLYLCLSKKNYDKAAAILDPTPAIPLALIVHL